MYRRNYLHSGHLAFNKSHELTRFTIFSYCSAIILFFKFYLRVIVNHSLLPLFLVLSVVIVKNFFLITSESTFTVQGKRGLWYLRMFDFGEAKLNCGPRRCGRSVITEQVWGFLLLFYYY